MKKQTRLLETQNNEGNITEPMTNEPAEIKEPSEFPVESTADKEVAPLIHNNVPPFSWSRNEYGLLNHIDYIFHDDGSVNWRAMIPNEYLVPNRQNFERMKLPVPKSIEGIEDKNLLVLLGGIKYVANLRGFTQINHEVTVATESYVAIKTTICLLPNYETDYKPVCFSDLSDAATFNTNSFAKYYLNAIAANRGFVRAWRNALRLPITAFDEIGEIPKDEESSTAVSNNAVSPHAILQKKMDEKNISFEKLKITSINKKNDNGTHKFENSDQWNSITDIPKNYVLDILTSMKEKESIKEKEIPKV